MKNFLSILLLLFFSCNKAPDIPLSPGKQLEGKWRLYSIVIDKDELITSFETYTYDFHNFNGEYGELVWAWTVPFGGGQSSDYFYKIDAVKGSLRLYGFVEDIAPDIASPIYSIDLKKDSLTAIIRNPSANYEEIRKAVRIK